MEVSYPVSPGEMIDRASFSHLGREQQAKLLAVFDQDPECSLDIPGWTGVVARSMPLVPSCGPICLHSRRVRERLKSFGGDPVVHHKPRLEWKKQTWKDQCSNGRSLS